ncbi:hypothetical protein Airi02_056450 [Actinoallomurus iriomotensis]|uniref:Uncharacterized protein n=1 Tax=Actinoallomurus iriomotensis TaxID=478107 RepID=A0A9W6S369_9ACTN|nr:hypothetical protein Airi02_056450 [Actinoallomurus iriomotensis]
MEIADRASGPEKPPVTAPDAVSHSPLGGSSGREANPASRAVRAAVVRGGIADRH